MKIPFPILWLAASLLLAGCVARSTAPCAGQTALGKAIPNARYLDPAQQERINQRLGEYLSLVVSGRNAEAFRYLSCLFQQFLGDPPEYGRISVHRLCAFTPDEVEQVEFVLRQDKQPGEPDYTFQIAGEAVCQDGGKQKKIRAVIHVSLENGDWYFSPLLYEGQFPDREILK